MPTPTTTINLPAEEFINENFDFSVVFDNTSTTDVGYGPFFDMVVPGEIQLGSANYLGAPITLIEYEWNGTEWEQGGTLVTEHPYDTNLALPTAANAGDKWYLVELPFGSFVPEQPEAEVTFAGNTLSKADGALVGTPLEITSQGGFRYGDDEFDTPNDAIQENIAQTSEITPKVIELTKESDAPEKERSTGENFPVTYTLTVDIANLETVDNLVISDVLPDNMEFLEFVDVAGGTVTQAPTTGAPANGNSFTIDLGSRTGSTSGEDIVITYRAYAPELDADSAEVIDANSGDDRPALNESQVTGTYDGTAISEATTDAVGSEDDPADYELTLKSIAIQKGVSIVGGGDAVPGKTLQYTLDFQISDYFSFEDINIEDIFSDGQRLDSGFAPTLQIFGNNGTTGTTSFDNFTGDVDNNFTFDNLTGIVDTGTPGTSTGATTLNFNVSQELIDSMVDADGILIGDEAEFGDGILGQGGTTGRIVYQTIIQDEFTDLHNTAGFSGDQSVDLDDSLSNTVNISGTLVADDGSRPATEADGSGAQVPIATPTQSKTIYAIDGDTNVPANPTLTPGQTVTYRITMELPSADAENLVITDFLPLPVFTADDLDADGTADTGLVVVTYDGNPPAAGELSFGPSHTLSTILPSTANPTVTSTGGSANTVAFDFGSFDDDQNRSATIDLLFTVTATDAPFTDGLYLTNQAQSESGNTSTTVTNATEIVQIELTQPELKLTKGVVSEETNDGTFDPGAPTAFAAPGSTAPAYTGGINSNNLDTANIDSNLSGVDAGDLVKFSIVVENTGGGGAFDLKIQDAIPLDGDGNPQFQLPTGGAGLNLQVFNGNGGTVGFTGDLFSGGININDDANGVIDKGRTGNTVTGDGSNLLIITYDLQVLSTAESNEPLTSEAQILEYSAIEGGNDYTNGVANDDWIDPASVTIDTPEIAKTLLGTEVDGSNNNQANQATIGEYIQYEVVLTVPEGELPNARLVDRLDAGLGFVRVDEVILSSGDITSTGTLTPAGLAANATSTAGTAAQEVTFTLGDLDNANLDNGTPETITIRYTAMVVNTTNPTRNESGDKRNNRVTLLADNGISGNMVQANAQNVTIVEPVVNVTQSVVVTETGTSTGDAGDTVTLTITLTHDASTPDAFETALTDAIPAEIQSPNLASATFNGTDVSGDFNLTGNDLTTVNPFDLTNGGEIVVTITGTLSSGVAPNQAIDNDADVTFSSLDGDGSPGVDPDTNILDDATNTTTDDRSTFVNTANNNNDERDYEVTSTGTVTIENVSPVKSIVGSSEAETDNTTTNAEGNVITDDVAIGETVTFRLVVGLSEGTINGLKLQDNLPDGMQFVNGTARVALVNTDTNNLTTNEAGLSGAIVANETDAFTPTVLFPDASVSTTANGNDDNYGSGTDIFFSFGNVTNTGTNAGSEFVVVEYDAVVLDVPGNEGGVSPTALTNNFDVIISGSSVNTSTDATVTVLEPELNITQTLTINGTQEGSGDAGDTVTIRLEVENTGTAAAFEVALNDLLDPTKFDIGSATATTTPAGFSFSNSTGTAGEVTFSGGDIPVNTGTPLVFEFEVPLLDAVEPGETLTSQANITEATTIDGTPTSGIERDIADPNDIEANDQSLTIEGPTLTTQLVETEINDGNNDNSEAVIGELVTYELTLTIPEGSTPSSVLSDTLDPGLAFVGFTSIDLDGATSTTVTDVTSLTNNTNVTNDGSDIAIDLGNLVNTGDNAGDQTITIQYQAVVQNVPANQGDGTETSPSLNNDPSFSWDNGTVQTIEEAAPSANVTVIEPQLDIVKEVVVDGSGTSGDGGDSVVYTITIEHTGDSTADAFDLNLSDALPPEFVPDGSPFSLGAANTSNANPGDFSIDGSNNLQVVPGNVDLALGQVLVLEIRGTIPDSVETGDTADSTATVTWTSLDGEVSNVSTHTTTGDEERTGDGTGNNDYTADDNAEFTITGAPEITTELVGSELDNSGSGGDNGNTDAVPGELVTFRTTITVPEGTTSGVVLQELLDPGLAFVEITNISTPQGNVTGGFDFTDEAAANTTAAVGTNGSDFTLNLGDVVNAASSDGTPETIVIEYTAVVLNDAANQSTDNETGPTLNNTATLDWTNNPTPGTPISATSATEVSVVEPQLQVIKDVAVNGSGSEGDAGDPVVYTITIQHTGNSEADAFDVNLTDVLPAGFVPDADAISVTNNTTGNTIQDSDFEIGGGNTLQLASGSNIDIPEDTLITLTVSGTLADSVQSGETVNSPAEITWTSVDGDASDISDHTTTGDTERTGADGETGSPNNYADSDDAPATVTGDISIEKTITDTSEPDSDTSGNNVAIGEVVTYQIAVTIPEGSTEGIVVTDDLPPGLQLTGTPTLITNDLNGTVTPLSTTGGTNSGDPITFNIDTATATGDNDPGNNTFIIQYQAVVLDEPGNADTTILTGDAQLVHNDATGTPIATPIEAPTEPTVTVVEPVLEIVQTLELNGKTATNNDDVVPDGDAGDTVTITLDVTNSGNAGAFEVEIQDLLDPNKFNLGTVNFVTTPDGMGNVNGDGISYTGVDIPAGETEQFVFTVELADGVSPGETLNNVASITEATTIDGTPVSTIERDITDPNDIPSNPEALIINGPMLDVTLVGTSVNSPNNGNTEATIGELVTHQITLTIPEGTTPESVLANALDPGLAFVEFTSITPSSGVTSNTVDLTDVTSLNNAVNNTTNGSSVGANGSGFTLDLGDLVNTNSSDGTPETIVLEYTAVVLNDATNQDTDGQSGPSLNSNVTFDWGTNSGDPLAGSPDEITVTEPLLTIQTEVLEDPSTAQENVRRNIGDTVRVRLTLSSDDADAFSADAFDVALSNLMPTGVDYAGNLAYVSGVNPDSLDDAGGTVSATYSTFPDGSVSVIEFDVTLNGDVTAGDITDTAQVTYTSLAGTPGTITSNNADSTERTGDGGLNDYRDEDPASITVNQPPETDDAEEFVAPSETINILNMGGNDTDGGTVDEFRIDTLPESVDGILYLGNPDDPTNPGTPVTLNQIIDAADIGNLYFEATPGFDGGEFTYSAIDNEGGIDQTPNTVTLTPNLRPETVDAVDRVPPEGTISIEGMGGSDPDGTVVEYEITSLPGDGTLFLGNPATGGTPVNVGDRIPAADIDDLHFTAPPGFTGTTFEYFSVDNEGATDLTPATVTIDSNPRPETNEVINNVPLSSNVPLTGLIGPLGGSDPNGTVDEYRIVSVPDAADGVLYLGDPANGGTVLSPNSTVPAGQINDLFFQSTGNFDGATFEYAAIDDEGAQDLTPATVTLNAPPETIDSNGTVPPNGTIPIENLGGSDPDTMVQFYTIDSLPPAADGTLYLGSATPGNEVQVGDNLTPVELEQLFFTASPTFTGDTTFTYHATDDLGLPDATPATVTITSIEGNVPPETVDTLQTIEPGTTVPLPVPPGSDFDGTVTGYQIDTLPAAEDGVLSLNGTPVTAGQVIPTNQIGNLVFEATPGFDGGEFTYSAVDNEGDADPTPATYTLNAPPTTEDVDDRVNPNDTLPLTALIGNDPDGAVVSYTIDTLPPAADGVLYLGDPANGGTPVTAGQVIPADDIDDLFFTASSTFTGTNFTYSATDDDGITDATPATVTLTPDGVNLAPQTENVEETVNPGDTLNIPDMGGDDPDGTVEEYRIDTLPEPEDGILYLGDPTNGGTPVNEGDIIPADQIDDLFFEATPEFDGTTFTYSAIDNLDEADPSPATVTLNPPNTPPETEDGIQTVQPGSPNPLDVPGGTDEGTVTGYTIDTLPDPADGILYIGDPNSGNTVSAGQTLTPTQLEQLVFVAEPGFDGGEFTYSAIDNDGLTDPSPATFTLNAPPETDDFTGNVEPNDTINLTSLGGSDPDATGSVVSYTIDTLPPAADGVLYLGSVAPGNAVTAGQVIPAADLDNLVFEASDTFTGTSFTYSATDDTGADDPTPATVNLIPDGGNVPPTTDDVEDTVIPGGTLNIPDMGGDDPDGTVDEYRIDTLPAPEDGILYLGDPNAGGTPIDEGDTIPGAQIDDLFFEATPEFDGTTFTYTAIDDEDGEDPTPATVTLNVPPETDNGAQEAIPGEATTLVGLGGDDADGTVEGFRIDSLPGLVDGVLYLGSVAPGNEIFAGQILTPEQIEQLVFDATNDFDGANFTYSAIDNDGIVDPTPATFDLVPPNDPPDTDDVTDNVAPEETINLTGLGGDDTDGTIAYYTITSLPPGPDGILYLGDPEVDGTPVSVGDVLTPEQIEQLHFEASPTYSGTSFTYAAADDDGASDPTPGTVTLGLGNLPPDTDDAINEVEENTTINLTGLGGEDPDGTIDFYTLQTLPNEGTLYLGNPASGGTPVSVGQTLTPFEIDNLYFEAPTGYSGDSNFNYTATDDDGKEDPTPATVFLPTPGGNLPPDTEDASGTAIPGETIQLTGLGGEDVDGGTVDGYQIDSLPPVGTLFVDDPVDGLTPVLVGDTLTPEQIENLFYEAPTDFTGDTTFTYSAIDNDGAVDPTPGTVTISALSDNIPPDTDNSSANVPPGGSVSLPGLGGDDPDGTVALYQINTLPSQGTLYIGNPSLGVTVTPGQILTPTQLEQLVFQAPPGFSGSSFTYSAIDNEGGRDGTPATVTLSSTVMPSTPPPFVIGGGNPSPTPEPTPAPDEPTVARGDREEPEEPEPTDPTPQPQQIDPNCVDCCPEAPELEGVYVAPPEALPGAPVPSPPAFDSAAFIPVPETILNGGNGNDSIEGTNANDELQGFEGDDRLEGSNGDDLIVGGISSPTPVGNTRDRDFLAGNQGRDFIAASEGNDTVYGGEDADVVLAGKDNDRVWGDRGDDTLLGELGDDTISGDSQDLNDGELSGQDLIYGGAGNDRLNGNEKNDTISGGDGDDFARGGQDDDLVYGDGGNDSLYGDLGDDTILGSLGSNAPIGHDEERDLLYGNQGRDLLKGGQGDDSIYAGQQDDLVYGGKDDDLVLGELGSDTLSGDLGDDTIRGGTGDLSNPDLDGRDLIYGGAGNDAIYGNEGEDTITAGDDNDLARGGQNNDLMFGDGGNDTLHGEFGDDTILGSLGSSASAGADDERDLLYGNQGSDLIKGGQGEDTVYAGKHEDLVYGGKDGDLIFGDQGSDTLSGDLGDDTIIGGTGNPSNPEEDTANDVIFGGDGRDLMDGNRGNDTIVSGSGDDIAFGGRGDDIIWGEAGNDVLFGDLGNDTLCGGDGDDLMIGSNGNPNSTGDGDDRLCGGAGNDSLFGNEGNDTLIGEDGDDCMFGGQGDDTLKGGNGNDLLEGDRGDDLLIGGSGSDVFVLRVGDGSDVITDFEVGVDLLGLADGLSFEQLTITQGTTGAVVSFGTEILVTLTGVPATSLNATNFTDRFKGQEPDEHDCPEAPTLEGAPVELIPAFTLETLPEIENVLIGNAGNDGIIGSDGNDSIRGLAGNDRADGEAGDDILVGGLSSGEPVGSDFDRDSLFGNQGNDVILGSEGEDFLYGGKDGDVILGGKDNDDIKGELGDDTLAGERGDDRIFGGTGNGNNPDTGNDLMYGGLGNDELYGNQGNDSISGGDGDDIAFGGKDDDLISGEFGNDTLEGEQGNDTILGSLGSSNGIGGNGERDWLSGNAGNDLIKGGEGEDTVYAGKDDDLVYGGKDNDVIYGDRGRDTLSGDLGDDTISGGTGVANNLESEADADVIFGGDGNDLIDGNLGNDSLVAGTGNDTVSGGRQDDVIWGEAGDDLLFGDLGNDTICAGEGNDTLVGSNGNPLETNDGDDKLCGGAGNDVVFGNEGNDRMSGDAGNDLLFAGLGDDTLTGGSGSDILSGEQGNDVLTGGAGVDRFDFADNHGINLITDFQDGTDRIGLMGGLTPEQLEIVQVDGNTQITAGDLAIVLAGVNATSIGADDFSIL
ncbi:MAG: isopeptide-forming domain-containing fimbrial protein [Cyanobacteriota bacterium]|nr:isopeptide-forming domain-containing fimbrial protein [Cyanobacteriota bacterium]